MLLCERWKALFPSTSRQKPFIMPIITRSSFLQWTWMHAATRRLYAIEGVARWSGNDCCMTTLCPVVLYRCGESGKVFAQPAWRFFGGGRFVAHGARRDGSNIMKD